MGFSIYFCASFVCYYSGTKWKPQTDSIIPYHYLIKKISDFVSHKVLPLTLICANGSAFICDIDGNPIIPLKGIDDPIKCAFHPYRPMCAIGSSNGTFTLYRIL